jgi:hypothetical protein
LPARLVANRSRPHDSVRSGLVGAALGCELFAAEQLISTPTDIDCVDRDIRRVLVALRRTLVKQRDAGTSWRARDAAEILAMLDMTAWISVRGLVGDSWSRVVERIVRSARVQVFAWRGERPSCHVHRRTVPPGTTVRRHRARPESCSSFDDSLFRR